MSDQLFWAITVYVCLLLGFAATYLLWGGERD